MLSCCFGCISFRLICGWVWPFQQWLNINSWRLNSDMLNAIRSIILNAWLRALGTGILPVPGAPTGALARVGFPSSGSCQCCTPRSCVQPCVQPALKCKKVSCSVPITLCSWFWLHQWLFWCGFLLFELDGHHWVASSWLGNRLYMRVLLMWGSGMQTLASEQLGLHEQWCYKAHMHCKISLACSCAACGMSQCWEGAQSKVGRKYLSLLIKYILVNVFIYIFKWYWRLRPEI